MSNKRTFDYTPETSPVPTVVGKVTTLAWFTPAKAREWVGAKDLQEDATPEQYAKWTVEQVLPFVFGVEIDFTPYPGAEPEKVGMDMVESGEAPQAVYRTLIRSVSTAFNENFTLPESKGKS